MKPAHLLLLPSLILCLSIGRSDEDLPSAGTTKAVLVFRGGHETDPRDHGRPVVLIAAALGVPPPIFREAFSHVHPAPPGESPDSQQVHQNKDALLSRLAPYGITNERLDQVSDYYRYRPGAGQLWRHADAAGYAEMRGGKVVRIVLTKPGAGYSSPPMVSVQGMALTVYPMAQLAFGTNLASNGSVTRVDLSPISDGGKEAPTSVPFTSP